MKVFHGSNQIVEEPKIIVGKFTKDFGYAFYCTKMVEQAEKWARRNSSAVINVYEYIENPALKIKIFDEMDDEWLDMIIGCRAGIAHNYDIVIGPMADDRVYNFVAGVIDGTIPREVFMVYAKFMHPTHQIAFCTEEALKTIQFVEAYEV